MCLFVFVVLQSHSKEFGATRLAWYVDVAATGRLRNFCLSFVSLPALGLWAKAWYRFVGLETS